MHEYSIVRALLDRVEEEVARESASRVVGLRLRLGELSGVEPALLASAFELVRPGTTCAAARLEIVSSAASWRCPRCGAGLPPGAVLRCDDCGLPAALASGDEILLERIEMEVDDDV